MKNNFSYHQTDGVPLKLWDNNVPFEGGAMQQLRNAASLPFIFKHVAGMPDVHWGKGATIGSVIATKGAIVPAAVGVDIGCGLVAARTSLTASDLPDNLHALRTAIEAAVPHGRTDNGGANDRGAWAECVPTWNDLSSQHTVSDILSIRAAAWYGLSNGYERIIEKHPKAKAYNVSRHLGTLGGGNHFVEICLDEDDAVWIMLHSGSRGPGNRVGAYFIERAKREMEKYYIDKFLPDKDLAYLVEHTELFDDYMEAVGWAQSFASKNREIMLGAVMGAMQTMLPKFVLTETAVNCHHNYVAKENHFGSNVLITRKGAVRARKGDLGIIPGSMGTGSFIVEGLGSKESFCSCSHGAGRKMSRNAAKQLISLEQHAEAMHGIEARLDKDVLDESPTAYKDINAVMVAQDDLVRIKHRLRQVVNIKG